MYVNVRPEGPQRFVATDRKEWALAIDPRPDAEEATSPPDLLLMSLASCTGLFMAPAAKELDLIYRDYAITAEGTKAKNPPKLFNAIDLTVTIYGEMSEAEGMALVEKAHDRCFILKSLNPNIEIRTKVIIEA